MQSIIAFILTAVAVAVYCAPTVSEEKPTSPRSLAETYMSEGKYSDARDELNKALKEKDLSDADKADIHLQIALSYYECGDYERAKPELEKVLTMPGAKRTQEREGGWANYTPFREAKLRLVKMNPSEGKQETITALFIGSSMTLRGYMPSIVEQIAASAPAGRPRIMTAMYVRGGTAIEVFWEKGNARDTARGKMASVPWDVVVIETSPRRPVASNLKYGQLFCDLARSLKIKPVLYENHVTRDEPYPDAHQKYHDDEVMLSKTLQSPLAPVQLAEMYYIEANPNAQLGMFYADKVHPSEKGYHLAAYCIYSAITGYSPVGLYHPESIPDEDAKAMQEAAWKAVQDANPDLKP